MNVGNTLDVEGLENDGDGLEEIKFGYKKSEIICFTQQHKISYAEKVLD